MGFLLYICSIKLNDMDLYKSGTIFGDTKRPNEQIKQLFPNAVFHIDCGFGSFIKVYTDVTKTKMIAHYVYLKPKEKPTPEAKAEKRQGIKFFKIIWKL